MRGSTPEAVMLLPCCDSNITEATYYRWRNKFSGLKAGDAMRNKT
jgi:hypothetical protein